jgi:hypothetical protein
MSVSRLQTIVCESSVLALVVTGEATRVCAATELLTNAAAASPTNMRTTYVSLEIMRRYRQTTLGEKPDQ